MSEKKVLRTQDLVLCALFSALIAVGAFIRIPLPLLPVPLTLQFFFSNLAGLVLGRRRGALAAAGYVAAGLAGLPIFAGGSGGIAYVLHPTFGYLIGFIAGSWVAGFVAERLGPGMKIWILAGGANLAVLYVLGMTYFYFLADVYLGKPMGLSTLVYSCCLIFLPGDLLKCFLGAVVAERLRLMLPDKILNGIS